MTPKEERFVAEYLIDLNGTQAAKRAGYEGDRYTLKVTASRLLTDANLRAAVREAMKARSRRTRITQDKVLRELAVIAFSDIGDYLDFTGDAIKPKAPKSICGQSRRALASWKTKKTNALQGEKIVETRMDECKLYDKVSALEKVMKHLGMFQQKEPLGVLLALLPEDLRESVRKALAEQVFPGSAGNPAREEEGPKTGP